MSSVKSTPTDLPAGDIARLPWWQSPQTLIVISPFFFWGSAMVAMKGVLPETTPYFLASLRLIPAGILVLAAAAFLGRPQPQTWRAWLWIGIFSLIDGTLFQGFLAQGLTRTGAGLGSVAIDSQPLAVALLARGLFGEAIGPIGWLGLAIGLAGISCIGLPPTWFAGDFTAAPFDSGVLLMLLAALSMALGTVSIRFVARYADPIAASGWHMILGGLPLLVLSGATETEQWQHIPAPGWGAIAYTTVFGGAIAYGVFFYLASQRNLTSFSSLTFLTPIFALLLGSLVLGETLTPLQWTGVAITLASVFLINQRQELATKLDPSTTLDPEPDRAN